MATSGRHRDMPRAERDAPLPDATRAAEAVERSDFESVFSLAPSGPSARLTTANIGDHGLIAAFLASVGRSPEEDFHHWLDAPDYRPADRLIIQHDGRVIGHVHLTRRTLEWGAARIPSVALHDLAVARFFGERVCRRRLLQAAEAEGRGDGALVATLRAPDDAARRIERGWIASPGHAMTHASARDLLAYLTPPRPSSRWSVRRRGPRVRVWRRVQLPVLMAIYRASTDEKTGAVRRNEAYWQWMLGRTVYEQVTVVESAAGTRARRRVVGYAMTRNNQIVELMHLPKHERTAVELLVRACRDAIEAGFETIAIHLPAEHPLHELVVTAGGTFVAGGATHAGELHARMLDAASFVRTLTPELHARARRAGLALPVSLVMVVDGNPIEFVVSRRGARLIESPAAPPDVVCRADDFDRLLLGQIAVPSAVAGGRLAILSDGAERKLAGLFPFQTIWQSPLDSRVGEL